MISSGATIGMLGGGQLGRMFVTAAHRLGYKVMVLEPDLHSPAGQLADEHIIAKYDDEQALHHLGKHCDVITTEFENIPSATLDYLTQLCPVHPSAYAVEMAQDRVVEKAFIKECGLLPAPYYVIEQVTDFDDVDQHTHFPAIIKTARLGYDGKGQRTVHSITEARQAFEALGQVPCVLEQRVALACEVSVVLARNEAGDMHCFPVAENEHRQGILHQTVVPARIDTDLAQAAQQAAQCMASKLAFVGVMAVEFFITMEGELLVNEMAPRTHNSGHFTLDACVTSQFEQQVRMLCGLPFGSTQLLSSVVMVNLLGDLWPEDGQLHSQALLQYPNAKLHLYGKKVARPGRKMGHYTVLADDIGMALQQTDEIFQALQAGDSHG